MSDKEIQPGCMPAADLRAGSTFLHPYKIVGERGGFYIMALCPVTVLRDGEACTDLFGRAMTRYWCRDDLAGREGWMMFGPGGVVRTEATPPYFVLAGEEEEDDQPGDYDGWITLSRGGYYLAMSGVDQGTAYPSREIAIYELAAWMAREGDFPAAWITGEHGPAVASIDDEVRAFHDEGGTDLTPLTGVIYAEGDEVIYRGDSWYVERDYGDSLGVVVVDGNGDQARAVQHSEITKAEG